MLQRPSEREFKGQASNEKHMPILESSKEEPGWPSFGQLIADLSKLSLEALASAFTQFIPSHFRPGSSNRGLTPLKDRLVMPEDEVRPPLVNRQSAPAPLAENRQVPLVHTPSTAEKYSEIKPPKIKSSSFKDPSLSSKHRSSKRAEYAEFYGSSEIPPYTKSKSQKKAKTSATRKSGEVVFGAEAKPVEASAVDHSNPKFDHYSMRTKYLSGESFRFNTQ
ncbi:hypothetical protein SESBI_01257 [Sesbania bispinosa]|nr:hypothetical protein SESBI_01257 [Sesbania bispinosa]